jgi:hypothetical protein
MVTDLIEQLKGFKTYTVAGSAAITLIIAWLHKDIATGQAIRDGVALLLTATMRAAVAKAEVPQATAPAVADKPAPTPAIAIKPKRTTSTKAKSKKH